MLPDGWTREPLQAVAPVIDCKHRTPHYVSEGIPIVSPGDISWGALKLEGCRRVSENDYSELMNHCSVRVGDIVFGRNQSVGISSVVTELRPFALGQDTVLIQPHKVDPTYLNQWLRSPIFGNGLRRLIGGSTFERINLKDLREVLIPIPPLPEQKKIADILSTWDAAIETTAKLLANAESQKRALMQQLLTGKRRLKGFEGKWKAVRLDEICDPKQWPTISKAEQTESGYPVFGANGQIGFYNQYNHEHETIVVTCRGATCGTVNMTPPRTYITGNAMSLDDVSSAVNVSFLFQLLAARGFNDIISGSAQPQIIGKDIKAVTINLPPLEEQKALAGMFEAWDKTIQNTGGQLDALTQEKSSLMQQLLTGKRRVKL